ncbi:MAG: hypothetical protein WDW38_011363 [Sanguina aurantia]
MTQQTAFGEDNYMQQLGELLALQSTVNEGDFRVWRERGMSNNSSSSSSSSSSVPTHDNLHLESLLESGESPSLEDQGRPIWCEVLVHVDVPASGIQLLLQFPDPESAFKEAASSPDSTASAVSVSQAAAAHALSPSSSAGPSSFNSVAGVGGKGAEQAQRGSRRRSQRSQRSQQSAGSSAVPSPGSSAHSSSSSAGMQAVSAATPPSAANQAPTQQGPHQQQPASVRYTLHRQSAPRQPRSSNPQQQQQRQQHSNPQQQQQQQQHSGTAAAAAATPITAILTRILLLAATQQAFPQPPAARHTKLPAHTRQRFTMHRLEQQDGRLLMNRVVSTAAAAALCRPLLLPHPHPRLLNQHPPEGPKAQKGPPRLLRLALHRTLDVHRPYPLAQQSSTYHPSSLPSALWLGAQQLQLLTAALLRQWEEQGPGVPIVYTWLDWLQSCALSELAVSDTLVLSPQHEQVEPRSSGSSVTTAAATSAAAASAPEPRAQSAEQVAGQVLRYCSRREAQVFARANQSCCICMEEYLGSSCLRLECEHHFCRGCLSQHCRTQLEEGAVDNLRCPQPKCRLALSPCALQQMLTDAELERFEALVLQRTLNAMQDIVYCPRAGCQTVCIEDGDHLAQCPTCFFAFCSLCGESWHAGTQCMDPATALEILAKRNQRGGGENRIADARKELDLLNQMKSLKLMAETTRRCPMCDMGIDKSEGCNKMTCLSCGTFFCWKCLSIIEGYDHFGRDSCSMFDLEEIQRWNAQMQEHAPPREAVAEARHMVGLMRDLGARPCFCPRCGQQNVKEGGNNDVRCWACSSHFCYLCRSAFAKSGAHFRAGGCKQHTL